MKAVLIGASDRTSLFRFGKVLKEDYERFVKEYGEFLAEFFDDVIVTPDNGVYTDVAEEFGRVKGKKAIAYYPDKDDYYGIDHIEGNFDKYNIKPIDGDWYKLNADLTKKALVVICLGFSAGTLIELCFIKFHQQYGKFKDIKLENIHIFVDERCICQRLYPTVEEQINNIFYYSSFNELARLIDKRRKLLE